MLDFVVINIEIEFNWSVFLGVMEVRLRREIGVGRVYRIIMIKIK